MMRTTTITTAAPIIRRRFSTQKHVLLLIIIIIATTVLSILVLSFCFDLSSQNHYGKQQQRKKKTSFKQQQQQETNKFKTTTIDRYLKCNSKTNNKLLPDGWCFDEDNVPRYVGRNNSKRLIKKTYYTPYGYDQCLANKIIIFVGDSRVRFQYMHLLDMLKNQNFMRCQDHELYNSSFYGDNNNNMDKRCSIIGQHTRRRNQTTSTTAIIPSNNNTNNNNNTKNWNAYYAGITKTMTTTTKQQQQQHTTMMSHLCDCYRTVPFHATQSIENQYVQRTTRHGTTKLIYIQSLTKNFNTIQMDKHFPPFILDNNNNNNWNYNNNNNDDDDDDDNDDHNNSISSIISRCLPGYCGPENRTNAFEGTVRTFLDEIIPIFIANTKTAKQQQQQTKNQQQQQIHVFANEGWEFIYKSDDQSRFSCYLYDLATSSNDNIKYNMISHPPLVDRCKDGNYWDPTNIMCNSIGLLDRTNLHYNVPPEWYLDKHHVLGILNEEYNHQMIQMICPI